MQYHDAVKPTVDEENDTDAAGDNKSDFEKESEKMAEELG